MNNTPITPPTGLMSEFQFDKLELEYIQKQSMKVALVKFREALQQNASNGSFRMRYDTFTWNMITDSFPGVYPTKIEGNSDEIWVCWAQPPM